MPAFQVRRERRPPAWLTSGALWFFLISLFLVHPAFVVTLEEMNPWDEAAYVNSGRSFLAGRLPSVADNPLVDVVYALTYLPFQSSPFWLAQSASLGRLLAYTLLWWSAYLVARQLSSLARPWVLMGIFLVTPLTLEMLRFPSDPLFASLAGFSFWALLRYRDTQGRGWMAAASFFLGLAALARNDGLVLFPILVALGVVATNPFRRGWTALLPAIVPFVGLVGGYLLVYGAATGDFSLGTMRRTYDNFEAGQQVVFAGSGEISPVVESKLEARRLFGTPQENEYSVFRAIRRNPQEYLKRLNVTLLALPRGLLQAYGIRFAAVLALLALRGLVVLVRRREFRLLALLLVWPAHLATGFLITLFRPGHLQFPYYVVFALAALGLTALLTNLRSRPEALFWIISLGGLAGYGWFADKLAIYYGAAVFLVALAAVALLRARSAAVRPTAPAVLLILLAAGLVLRGGTPSPVIPRWGQGPREQAVVYMTEHLAPGTKVAAGSPGIVWAARMTYSGLASPDVPRDKSPREFHDWMARQGIRAVYVDHSLYNTNPAIWSLIQARLGSGIERVFTADRGDIQVLLVAPPPPAEGGDE